MIRASDPKRNQHHILFAEGPGLSLVRIIFENGSHTSTIRYHVFVCLLGVGSLELFALAVSSGWSTASSGHAAPCAVQGVDTTWSEFLSTSSSCIVLGLNSVSIVFLDSLRWLFRHSGRDHMRVERPSSYCCSQGTRLHFTTSSSLLFSFRILRCRRFQEFSASFVSGHSGQAPTQCWVSCRMIRFIFLQCSCCRCFFDC